MEREYKSSVGAGVVFVLLVGAHVTTGCEVVPCPVLSRLIGISNKVIKRIRRKILI